ncbi:winged helix-turn-helix transcriptional regulator [Yinghuangia seranimata]|uniref:winged helix-turn-helix transcriptional regulator n=1 Tax=Yinghuangia seranimata TaxID=408067 RepID=UPI00248C028C|nr:helix-turn-helix domain-containing protein [Yinghuangia seranimata]MDI2129108.1 helix-turn-helix domain-containing protein [Yinghuangia seranimata]
MEPNVFDPECGSRAVLDLVADKWSALVLYALRGRALRHAELKRAIGGISQKMLTQTLRSLEADGIVRRVSFPVVPPHVEYSLTPLGASLSPLLTEVCRWAEEHLGEIQESRDRAGAGAAAG